MKDGHSPRTVLDQLIQDRRQTFEEFSADAQRFAYEHGLKGTLSPRHAQRLAAGHRDGQPLRDVRPATRELLETMFGRPIHELIGKPTPAVPLAASDVACELSASLAASRSIDHAVIRAFQEHVNQSRVIDRRLGAPALLGELRARVDQMQRALHYALAPDTRKSLAAVLVDTCALAGWLSLDSGSPIDSWNLYNLARVAALEAESPHLQAYARAGQSVVLLDIGQTTAAVELTAFARSAARGTAPQPLNSWLAAAHGEALAANGDRSQSLRAFDDAARLMPAPDTSETPYLVFDEVHLSRWRGNALARLGQREAIDVLSRTLTKLDPTFTRAEVGLRADLAQALISVGEHEEALRHVEKAGRLALQIGSVRQRARIGGLRESAAIQA